MTGEAPTFFFTAEDPREIPRGSRDPLRYIPVWAAAGRELVPYLTTVTPSYRGFLTRFLFHGALQAYQLPLAFKSSEAQWLAFCRFEQLCAIVRTKATPSTPALPGTTGISGRLGDAGGFNVGSHSRYWLGKSQKNTGFWGYYHRASLGSGLLEYNRADRSGYVLSDESWRIFQDSSAYELILRLKPALLPVLQERTCHCRLDDFHELARYFAFKPNEDAKLGPFWRNRLLTPNGESDNASLQQAFASRLKSIYGELESHRSGDIWEVLAGGEQQDLVTAHARRVRSTEAVIGLTEWVFDACRLKSEEGTTLPDARDWAAENGYDQEWLSRLRSLAPPKDPELARLREIALEKKQDSFVPLAREILSRHRKIMRDRGAAAWVACDEADLLTIREPEEAPSSPDLERYPSGVRWRYDYFLHSWRIAAEEIGFLPEVEGDG